MGQVHAGMTMSLDGFVTDRDGKTTLLYPAFDELMASGLMQEIIATTGAVAMGRNSYSPESDYSAYEFQVPLFILTHTVPTTAARGASDKLSFTFVTDGVESLIQQANAPPGIRMWSSSVEPM
jgi:dihydrofolate reductase